VKWSAEVLIMAYVLVAAGQEVPPSIQKPREVRIDLPPGRKIQPTDKITPAKLITKVNPAYPPLARQTRISGIVKFHATIGDDGTVSALELISGHPLLVKAASDAVKQWKYEPTRLNDEPVEIDTTIDVVFSLKQEPPKTGEKQGAK
jgi:protein TonB